MLSRALEADEARRNEAETDPLMTALGLPYPTIIGIVGGGEWASTVLDRVTADGRYGVRLGQSAADAEAELRAAIAAACAADPFLRDHPATIEITGGRFGSARVASDHPLPVGLAETVEAVTGRRPALLGEPYGADMQMFVNVGATAVRHLRAGRRPGRPQRRRARPARRGRGLRARPRGVGRARADRRQARSQPAGVGARAGLCSGDLDEPAQGVDHPHLLGRPAARFEERRARRRAARRSGPARSRR